MTLFSEKTGENQSGNGPRTRADSSAWSWCQTVYKPGSVSPVRRTVWGEDGHSSGTPVTGRLARPTRAAAREARPAVPAKAGSACRSYLVLLPVGFALPPPLPAARCALTAPFHPCRPCCPKGRRGSAVCFCGTFPRVAPAGRYPAPCLRGARTFLTRPRETPSQARPSDRLAWDQMGSEHQSVKARCRPRHPCRPETVGRRRRKATQNSRPAKVRIPRPIGISA